MSSSINKRLDLEAGDLSFSFVEENCCGDERKACDATAPSERGRKGGKESTPDPNGS